jgi:hypothetical protein
MRDDLHNIRRVRNAFARFVTPMNFGDPAIVSFCSALKSGAEFEEPRNRFLSGFGKMFTALVLLREMELRIERVADRAGFDEKTDAILDRLLRDNPAS